MNDFKERYKELENSELLRILENSDDYQTEAVEAAQFELDKRQLSEAEWNLAKDKLLKMQQDARDNYIKQQEWKQKGTSVLNRVLFLFNPFYKGRSKIENQISLISLVFTFFSVYWIVSNIKFISFVLFSGYGELDCYVTFVIMVCLLLPFSTALFILRKRFGWILLALYQLMEAMYLIYNLSWTIITLKSFKNISPSSFYPYNQIITILVFLGTLWIMMRPAMRSRFEINRKILIYTVLFALICVSLVVCI